MQRLLQGGARVAETPFRYIRFRIKQMKRNVGEGLAPPETSVKMRSKREAYETHP